MFDLTILKSRLEIVLTTGIDDMLLDDSIIEREIFLDEIISTVEEFLTEELDTVATKSEPPAIRALPKEIFAHIAPKQDKSEEVGEGDEGSGC